MERMSSSAPEAPKPAKGAMQRFRDAIGRTKTDVAAKFVGAALGAMSPDELAEPLDKVAETQEMASERRVEERKDAERRRTGEGAGTDPERALRERTLETAARLAFEGRTGSAELDCSAGFESLSPLAIERITTSAVDRARLLSHADQFPSADQLGQFAGGHPTIYLNTAAYERHLPHYGWIEVSRKIRPDREWRTG